MTMLDVPVVYTVETSDCESILTECQEALEAVPMDVATRKYRSRFHTYTDAI
jgi:hypothetical protein